MPVSNYPSKSSICRNVGLIRNHIVSGTVWNQILLSYEGNAGRGVPGNNESFIDEQVMSMKLVLLVLYPQTLASSLVQASSMLPP